MPETQTVRYLIRIWLPTVGEDGHWATLDQRWSSREDAETAAVHLRTQGHDARIGTDRTW